MGGGAASAEDGVGAGRRYALARESRAGLWVGRQGLTDPDWVAKRLCCPGLRRLCLHVCDSS
jgi:hypothetical protein